MPRYGLDITRFVHACVYVRVSVKSRSYIEKSIYVSVKGGLAKEIDDLKFINPWVPMIKFKADEVLDTPNFDGSSDGEEALTSQLDKAFEHCYIRQVIFFVH